MGRNTVSNGKRKLVILIRLALLIYLTSLAGPTAHSAIGIGTSGNRKYLLSDHPITKENLLIATELDTTSIPSAEGLWITLQPFHRQADALSPPLRGTFTGQTLLSYDLELKRRFSEHLRKSFPNEAEIDTTSIRLWISPEKITLYQGVDITAVTQVRLRLRVETINSTSEDLNEILEEVRRGVENELNTSERFRGLRDALGLFYCFRETKGDPLEDQYITIYRFPISRITQAYLKQFVAAESIGGIVITGKAVEKETIEKGPTLPYKRPIPYPATPPSYEEYFLTLAGGNDGILPYLFSNETTASEPVEHLPAREVVEAIESQNKILMPEEIKTAIKGTPYPEQVIRITHYAIENNLLVPERIIRLCRLLWREMGREERERILANLLGKGILLVPKAKEPTLSRRKFLNILLASTAILSLPNPGSLIPAGIDAETFLLLDPTTQARIISRMQKDPLGNLELSLIMREISSKIVLGEFLYEVADPRKDPLKILFTLIRSRAMFLLSREAQTALLRDLFYLANQKRPDNYIGKQAKEEILHLCKDVATMARSYPQDTVFACALFVVVNQEYFSPAQVEWALKVITPRSITKDAIPQLEIVATYITDKLNKIHDEYETGNWQSECKKFLHRLPTKLIYITIALSEPNLYTATYNLTEDLLLSQARSYAGFNRFLRRLDPLGILQAHFITALSRRHYDLYHWAKENISPPEAFVQYFINTSLKILLRDGQMAYQFESIKDVYIIHALRRFLLRMDPKDRDRYLHRIEEFISDGTINLAPRYLLYYGLKDLVKPETKIRLPDNIERLNKFLDYPPYPRDGRLDCLVIYNHTSAGYYNRMMPLLKRHGFKMTSRNRFSKRVGKTTIIFTLQVWEGPDPERFKETIESGKYDIVFTRHHSYEGKEFAGVGSEMVLPQFIGTKGTGYGDENNLLSIVLAEEIAKAEQENLTWKGIKRRLRTRISIDDFIFPDSFLFKLTYVSVLLNAKDRKGIRPTPPVRLLIVDGGCGGINRIPPYIFKYAKAMHKLGRANDTLGVMERINRTIERVKTGLARRPIVIPISAGIRKLLELQQEIDRKLNAPRKGQSSAKDNEVGGIILSP